MLRVAAVFVLGALLLWGSMWQVNQPAGPCTIAGDPAALPDLPEASGLAVSRRDHGLLWSHNDSGNAAVLVALNTTGTVRGRIRLPFRTRDWEDISAARCSSGECLYIADIGDNRARRNRITIFRIPEPATTARESAQADVFHATYADGPHNAEAMFVIGADLFIVTRDRTGAVYRAQAPPSREAKLTFHRVGELGLQSVSDAEASPDEQLVVVRNWQEAVFYRAADIIAGRIVAYRRTSIDGLRELQGEGVAFDGDVLYLASEAGPWGAAGTLRSLRCHFSERS
jgi:hypothetical protein